MIAGATSRRSLFRMRAISERRLPAKTRFSGLFSRLIKIPSGSCKLAYILPACPGHGQLRFQPFARCRVHRIVEQVYRWRTPRRAALILSMAPVSRCQLRLPEAFGNRLNRHLREG
jgi:hypothetical protein